MVLGMSVYAASEGVAVTALDGDTVYPLWFVLCQTCDVQRISDPDGWKLLGYASRFAAVPVFLESN